MAGRSVTFDAQYCHLCDSHLEQAAKWLSCNGEAWGVGPTVVFASAAALFLYNELEATIFMVGDHLHASLLEKTMVSTTVLGMLALMIHLWVCSMRFFQFYLDTLIKDSPNMLLEMTTAGLLRGQELAALGPLTRFLKTQQPQIHITICWFLSLCYADYVRKHYCHRFNLPYLDQWQAELQERAARQARHAMQRAHSFVGSVHRRLRGFAPPDHRDREPSEHHTVRACLPRHPWKPASRVSAGAGPVLSACYGGSRSRPETSACASSRSPATRRLLISKSYERIYTQLAVNVAVHRTPARLAVAVPALRSSLEDCPWRSMARLPFD